MFFNIIFFNIGYGNIVCRSDWGKIFTMIFALLAIPACTASLIFSSVVIICLVQLAIIKVEHCFLRRPKLMFFQRKSGIIQLSLFLASFFGTCFGYIHILVNTEDRSKEIKILDSIYFTFITLTTIGFGDIVQDHEKMFLHQMTVKTFTLHVLSTLNAYVSLGLAASLINLMANLTSRKNKNIENK